MAWKSYNVLYTVTERNKHHVRTIGSVRGYVRNAAVFAGTDCI